MYPAAAPAGVVTLMTPDQPAGLAGVHESASGGEFEADAIGEIGAGAVGLQG